MKMWDVFISHASEDKDSIARPLAEALTRCGVSVWYDEFTLTLGDSLRRSIDQGLSQSRFGLVIVSPDFLEKEWPQRELDGLVAREIEGVKVILPIWHNVSRDLVLSSSPTLADRLAASSDKGISHIVGEVLQVVGAGKLDEQQRGELANPATREEEDGFKPQSSTDAYSTWFLSDDDAIGIADRTHGDENSNLVHLAGGARTYMRIWPLEHVQELGNVETLTICQRASLAPFCSLRSGGWSYLRNRFGVASYSWVDDSSLATNVTQLFRSREIWGVESYYLNIKERRETISHPKYIPITIFEQDVHDSFERYLNVLRYMGMVEERFTFEVGVAPVEGYELAVDRDWFGQPFKGRIYENKIDHSDVFSIDEVNTAEILLPFFQKIYDFAGFVRPNIT